MPNTYVALRTETLVSAASSVTFSLSGISGYTDLVLVTTHTCASGSNNTLSLQFNGDTTNLYSRTFIYGDGSTAGSARGSNETAIYTGFAGSNSDITQTNINIQNYNNATTFKTVLSRSTVPAGQTRATVSLWRKTPEAITSILIFPASGTFAIGSTFSLYGIANADQGAAKATGGIITEDSTYWYHTFGASGAFIPKQSLTADVLVVAGGGGSGVSYGAGGGGGGIFYKSSNSLTAISYNVTVGAGGTGLVGAVGNNGGNSTFGSLTTASGGGGGGGNVSSGLAGGSGGGGGGATVTSGGAANQSSTGGVGYGNAGGGGAGPNGSDGKSGGGGGAGSAGGPGTTSPRTGGAAGNGTGDFSSWGIATSTGILSNGVRYYSGGGAGLSFPPIQYGDPGTQGGNTATTNGVANTGQGAGADGPCNGGSGVVIVRYLKA
jgi:hypothetical protein